MFTSPQSSPPLEGRDQFLRRFPKSLIGLSLFLLAAGSVFGQVVRINEIVAATSERLIRIDDNGRQRLGAGPAWHETGYSDAFWSRGTSPFGFGLGGLGTDLSASGSAGVTALYLRTSFQADASQASSSSVLRLRVDYNDGFIAYLNGVEIARRNMGASGSFAYVDQEAHNVHNATGLQEIDFGVAGNLLQQGENILGIQVHNNVSSGGATLKMDAHLEIVGTPTAVLVPGNAQWNYFAGVIEPAGGWFDTGLIKLVDPAHEWTLDVFDDAGWAMGVGPLGYDASADYLLGTNLLEMRNVALTLFMRNRFSVSQAEIDSSGDLQLSIDYDDGFVAYLNGQEVARRNVGSPGVPTTWNQPASGSHGASRDNGGNNPAQIATFTVSKSILRSGENLFTAVAHNTSTGSSDLLVDPTLSTSGAAARDLVNPGDSWSYFVGSSPPVEITEDGRPKLKFSDWIELHNPGSLALDLTGWSLTDNPENPDKWIFPAVIMQPDDYLVVFASEEDLDNRAAGGAMHTDFKLSARGEYLGLYNASGGLVHEFSPGFPAQDYFHSWGWDESTSEFRYFDTPTPGALNSANGLTAIAAPPQFDHQSGFYNDTLNLTLTTPTPGATIRFTTDGSDPTATNGISYSGSFDPLSNVSQGSVVYAEIWTGVGGTTIAGIPLANPPSIIAPTTSLSGATDWADSYGTRIRGWLNPPTTGAYTFWIATDDNGEFWLSTDDQPANRTRIAHVPGWAASQQWDKFPEQQSVPITLQAGSSYYFEALQKEGGGGDNLAVAWAGPGVPMQVIPAEHITPVDLTATNSLPTGVVVKARAFSAGGVPSDTVTRSYLFNQDPRLQTLPAVVLSGDPGNSIYAPNGALSIVGGTYTSGTWSPVAVDDDYNFAIKHGRPWERKATMEFIETDNTLGFSTDIGLRVAGSPHARPRYRFTNAETNRWTGSWVDKPSFNFYFRDDFGLNRLEHEIFPGSRVTSFDDFRLRAGKNDSTNPFIKDEFIRRLFINMGQIGSRGLLCNLFVNGQYKGYYNLAERVREEFLREWHNTDKGFDIWHIREITEGDRAHYDVTMNMLRSLDMSQQANYAQAAGRVDMANYIDYTIVNTWSAMGDWPHNNYIVARERTDPGPWRFYVWDAEGCCGGFGHGVSYNSFTSDLHGTGHMTSLVYDACQPNEEFRLLFADRVQKHFFNGGGLTPGNINEVYRALRDELNPTMQAVRNQNVSEGWYNTWSSQRPNIYFSQLSAEGLWPSTTAPTMNPFGGGVVAGSGVTLGHSNPTGILYFTTDGTDPRAVGGAAQGTVYNVPLTINSSTTVKARVLTNGIWSPLTEVTFSSALPELVISELHYNPTGSNDTAFIELLNAGSVPIDLTGIYFSDGVGFTFAGGSLAPGEVALVVENELVFSAAYPGVPVAGQYTGALDNGGETVTISDLADKVIYSVTYDDEPPWPTHPDAGGSSLVPLDPAAQGDPNDPANWITSGFDGGTPGNIPPTTLSDWLGLKFTPGEAGSGMLDDGDGDRGDNLLEYSVLHDPKQFDSPFATISVVREGSDDYLSLTFRRNLAARDVTMSVEVSSDLENWEAGPAAVVQVGPPVINGDGSETVTFRDLTPLPSLRRRFMRLQVTLP